MTTKTNSQVQIVCSYLRGRLNAHRVEHVDGSRFRITFRRLGENGDKQVAEGELSGICQQYGITGE